MQELGIGGRYSIAWDINDAGQVVGEWSPSTVGGSHAFVYRDGALVDLGDLGGDVTYALSINERGDIVGYGGTGRGDTLHGFIYADGELVDLNTLLVAPDGWEVARTSAINDARQIAALACRTDAYRCVLPCSARFPSRPHLYSVARGCWCWRHGGACVPDDHRPHSCNACRIKRSSTSGFDACQKIVYSFLISIKFDQDAAGPAHLH